MFCGLICKTLEPMRLTLAQNSLLQSSSINFFVDYLKKFSL
jgi:hypothetical protein